MDTLQWLERLISFNSISNNSNLEIIKTIDEWFKLHHIPSQVIPGPAESRVNLFATIPATNGQTEGGILLSGHTDVVPVGGQIWNTDPFVATKLDNKIYGRGTCDMKGFLAVILALTPEFKKLKRVKPIHFSFTCDEEVGCLGIDYVIDFLKTNRIQPEGCIVGEPSNMRPIIGGKARKLYHCQIQGKAAHSSLAFEGCNAIEYGSRLINYINSIAHYIKENGPFDNDFDCPFSTITINIVSGGIATNVIPGTCEFILEVRYINQFPIVNFRSQIENYINETLLPEMKKTYSEARVYFDETSDAPGFQALESSSILKVVRAVTGINDRLKVSYGTEASVIQNANVPTVICGPGDIKQAHNPNEFVTIEQLNLCEKIIKNVVTLFCTHPQSSDTI